MKILIFCVLMAIQASGQGLDMDILAEIESGHDPKAVNRSARVPSYGLYQVAPICLRAYNQAVGTKFTVDDLLDSATNRAIAVWYIEIEIPRILRRYRKPVTTRNLLISYNAGVRYVKTGDKIPAITSRYIDRYLKRLKNKR